MSLAVRTRLRVRVRLRLRARGATSSQLEGWAISSEG